MIINFKKLGIETGGRTSGKMKVFCPQCRGRRKNKRDKSLSINLDNGLYNCHYCGFKGCAKPHPNPLQRRGSSMQYPPAGIPLSFGEGRGEAVHSPLSSVHKQWLREIRHIPDEVLTWTGITSSTQFMPQTGKKEECICFNYFEKGELVNTKFRTLNKHFKLTSGAELIPYNIDGILNTPECIITEGEIDTLSFIAAGRTDVISVPGGANRNLTWMDRFVESHFEDKEVIYIAVDTDRKGLELKQELLRRLGAERCRVVTFAQGCKDANEQLIKYGPESLTKAIEDAPQTPLEGVFTAKDVKEEMRIIFENGLSRGAETGLENLDKLCTFELGRLCVVTGIPGCGKSEFVDELVLRLNLRHEWKTAFFSPENMPIAYHLRKLSEKLCGISFTPEYVTQGVYEGIQKWLGENVFSILPKENFTVDTILSRAKELVRRFGIRALVFDPVNKAEHQIPAGQTETQYLSAFLDKLILFAQQNNCLVIVVAHPTKLRREPGQTRDRVPTLYDINGSAAFFNKCDFGLVIERDREAGVTRVHVEKVKFRHLGNVGTASFIYNTSNGRFTPCVEDPEGAHAKVGISGVVFDSGNWIKKDDNEQLRIEGLE